MTDEERRACIIDFINRSFRDIADQDYLSARLLYRADLVPQFLWAAQQAVEKYLKAILLYSDISTKGLRHDLDSALDRLNAIKDITFDIPDRIKAFIHVLNEEGPNRYFEYPAVMDRYALHDLDRTVWCLRRYCQWLRGPSTGGSPNPLPDHLAAIHAFPWPQRHRFRIAGGHLEEILSKPKHPQREALVWKNFCYGRRSKRRIKSTLHYSFANPTHYLKPEIFDELSKRVQFSKEVTRVLQTRTKTGSWPAKP